MPRTNYIQLRLSDSEIASYKSLADKADLSCASWMRERLNLAVSLAPQNLLLCGHPPYRNGRCAEMSCQNYINKHQSSTEVPTVDPLHRELSTAELSCPVHGCSLGSSHSGPCIPSIGDSETKEIYIQNLIVLSRDVPEGFRNKIRELLSANIQKGDSK